MPFAPVRCKCLKPKDTDFEPRTIGEHVKKRRLLLKLTQKAVAHILGVTQFSIINWERGDFQPCRAPTLCRIIAFLGYDPLPVGASLPERLRAKRRYLGWGQRALARHLGVNPCTIKDWEGGGLILKRSQRVLVARFLGLPEQEMNAAMRRQWNDSHSRITLL